MRADPVHLYKRKLLDPYLQILMWPRDGTVKGKLPRIDLLERDLRQNKLACKGGNVRWLSPSKRQIPDFI